MTYSKILIAALAASGMVAVSQAATLTVANGETNNFNTTLDVTAISIAAGGTLNLQGGALTHTTSTNTNWAMNGDVVVTGGDHLFGDRLTGTGSITIVEDGATGFTIRQMNHLFTGDFNFQVAADGGVTAIDSVSWMTFAGSTLNVDLSALGADFNDTITLFDCSNLVDGGEFGAVNISGIDAERWTLTQDTVTTQQITLTVVPEPSSFALLAGCFALTSIMVRRRRR